MSAHAQRRPSANWLGVFVTLALLATLLQAGSPGFNLTDDGIWTLAKYFPKSTQQKIEKKQKKERGQKKAKEVEKKETIPVNVDIPNLNLGLYQEYAGRDWAIVAGIYKIESDHGRSKAPGVHSGVNTFGCCAGPGQFNVRNGHPSTWETWRPRKDANVYDSRDAVPATVKMLRSYYRGRITRTCANNYGLSDRWVNAIRHYNNACWYVRDVAAWVHTYDKAPTKKPRGTPRAKAKIPNGLTFTTEHGCDPAKDFRKGILTPEVQGFMLKLARRHAIRISCGATGHSQFVKGTSRQSAHWTGRAFDVDMVDGQVISPGNPHNELGKAALDYGARQVGGPAKLCGGRRCFTDDGHQGHWHIQP